MKQLIKRMLPSFRASKSVLNQCEMLQREINDLKEKIKDTDKKNEYLFFLSQRLSGETELETRKRIFLEIPKASGELRQIQQIHV